MTERKPLKTVLVATVDNWCKRYFRTVALRDSETEVSIHNSCSLLTEGCSWER